MRGTKRWDTCAGEALLAAAGAGWLVNAETGGAYQYGAAEARAPGNTGGVIAAADPALYADMAAALGWPPVPPQQQE